MEGGDEGDDEQGSAGEEEEVEEADGGDVNNAEEGSGSSEESEGTAPNATSVAGARYRVSGTAADRSRAPLIAELGPLHGVRAPRRAMPGVQAEEKDQGLGRVRSLPPQEGEMRASQQRDSARPSATSPHRTRTQAASNAIAGSSEGNTASRPVRQRDSWSARWCSPRRSRAGATPDRAATAPLPGDAQRRPARAHSAARQPSAHCSPGAAPSSPARGDLCEAVTHARTLARAVPHHRPAAGARAAQRRGRRDG